METEARQKCACYYFSNDRESRITLIERAIQRQTNTLQPLIDFTDNNCIQIQHHSIATGHVLAADQPYHPFLRIALITMYPLNVVLTLLGMIVFGSGRIVAIKLYFQMEEEESRTVTPLFVTLLYLVGQTLSLLVYFIQTRSKICICQDDIDNDIIDYITIEMAARELDGGKGATTIMDEEETLDDQICEDGLIIDNNFGPTIEDTLVQEEEGGHVRHNGDHRIKKNNGESIPNFVQPQQKKMIRRGSKTGLTTESNDAIAWMHSIPWYLKPAIPGFFNLCNSALRWGCLVYVAASTAEILISGIELILSSFAARIIRKRIVSTKRWFGISIVTLGIILVGFAKVIEKKENDSDEQKLFIGNILIIGQCFFSVLQDLSEEIFMQETNFPATLLLGMEGLFGLIFGIPIYLLFFPPEQISSTPFNIGYEIMLVLLVAITGILNIRTTEVTSSMTRNVWKQFRIILVWILGLLLYYVGGNDRLGEAWVIPGSFFVLGGFSVILSGVYFYYS
jgi:drug/metabolite transporter (DMT)-like permease